MLDSISELYEMFTCTEQYIADDELRNYLYSAKVEMYYVRSYMCMLQFSYRKQQNFQGRNFTVFNKP